MPRGMMGGRHRMGPMMDPRSKFFMAMASDQRIRILEILKDGEKSSSDIISVLNLDSSVVSRHLMLMRNTGLVSARKEGVSLFFRLADDRVLKILDLATNITKDWFNHFQNFFK
jgi:ArsR family transcriptional regulator